MKGKPPAARDGHTACVIGSRIYIFGGYEEEVLNEPVNTNLVFTLTDLPICQLPYAINEEE